MQRAPSLQRVARTVSIPGADKVDLVHFEPSGASSVCSKKVVDTNGMLHAFLITPSLLSSHRNVSERCWVVWLPAGTKLPKNNEIYTKLNIGGKKIRKEKIRGVRVVSRPPIFLHLNPRFLRQHSNTNHPLFGQYF
jgi:hypothetical protein